MHNQEIAWALSEIADLLEIQGEKPWSWRKAARVVEGLESPATLLQARGQLEKIPGIGPAVAQEIDQIVHDGVSRRQRKLRQQVPPGLMEVGKLPGIGVATVQLFFRHGFTTLEELEEAARARKLRRLPGMGPKTEAAVLRGIEFLRRHHDKYGIGIVKPIAEDMCRFLRQLAEVQRAEITGPLRRGQELLTDVQILIVANPVSAVLQLLRRHPSVEKVLAEGPQSICVANVFGLPLWIEAVDEADFARRWVETTGPAAHWQQLQSRKSVTPANSWSHYLSAQENEEAFYQSLGLPWIPPELRANGQEVAQALAGQLPALIEAGDLRGDLHMHTGWSDGVSTLEEMIQAGREQGYEYMAITDHSRALSVARGLSEAKLQEQRRLIRQYSGRDKTMTVLAGIEMDILPDARLDYPDELLEGMDLVIASVHTHLRQERSKIHQRIETALKNPHVDILAHPTGRLIGHREPFDVDVEWMLELAAKTGTALEINSTPDRLDLAPAHARMARELGIPIVINTDAHDRSRLGDIRYGVTQARRAGLEAEDVLNTRPLKELQAFLDRSKG
ncbi:DNA polymerase/3'-5' exonuclease PolX [Heliophilum fasciatum]|uniref:DNA polymerase (Family 10) n=1 Tax=Heliophilum fasciatum TaxID=35700 RepID=A0A4R2RYZ6_9FIRM|nr:DNA polymerase/3'-5' exonuclease PolX [Heliophilum fasciatum]MCW2276766.1 DNA polymerase (family 10) [Heliophilum fasciatum]TCP68853.1 DNA polymerase (family 10) [Heliophilum fasciatum]